MLSFFRVLTLRYVVQPGTEQLTACITSTSMSSSCLLVVASIVAGPPCLNLHGVDPVGSRCSWHGWRRHCLVCHCYLLVWVSFVRSAIIKQESPCRSPQANCLFSALSTGGLDMINIPEAICNEVCPDEDCITVCTVICMSRQGNNWCVQWREWCVGPAQLDPRSQPWCMTVPLNVN